MLSGIYGLLSASLFVVLDAVDVAITEASVGAGLSTILMLTTLAIVGRYELSRGKFHTRIAFVLTLFTGGLLVYGMLGLPYFADGQNPTNGDVASFYLNETKSLIDIPNYVTAVLASFRGFDTFGELYVVFTAGIAVLALLASHGEQSLVDDHHPMHHHLILRVTAKALIPLILLFAFYVQFHGDFGPGGGFQAGIIFAAAIILYSMIFGLPETMAVINLATVRFFAAIGVLLYGSVGVVSMLFGHEFLNYSVLNTNPITGQHIGILLIELGVGITVAAVMITIFYTFSGSVANLAPRQGGNNE